MPLGRGSACTGSTSGVPGFSTSWYRRGSREDRGVEVEGGWGAGSDRPQLKAPTQRGQVLADKVAETMLACDP